MSGIAIAGRVRLKFEADGSALAVSFLEAPAFRCDVACHVTLGQVPMPIQAELGRVVRDEAIRWLTEKMVAPNEHVRRADSSLTSRGDAAAAGRGESVETHRRGCDVDIPRATERRSTAAADGERKSSPDRVGPKLCSSSARREHANAAKIIEDGLRLFEFAASWIVRRDGVAATPRTRDVDIPWRRSRGDAAAAGRG